MKFKFHFSCWLLFFVFLQLTVIGQIKTKHFSKELPDSLISAKSKKPAILNIPIASGFKLLKENASKNNVQIDNKFAISSNTNIDFISRASYTEENNYAIYYLSLKAEGALNISVHFSEFQLPSNTILTIFSKKEITDSINEQQNNENNIWSTRVYQGEELSFILKLHKSEIKNLSLKIGKVNIGYKPMGDYGNINGSAQGCHFNVVCPEGNGWNAERNSIALIVVGGTEHCTGGLIMNSCSMNIPYFLTAEHCTAPGGFGSWVFQFQTWSTTCIGNNGWIETVQYNGSQLKASNVNTDVAILQLNTTPAANSGLHYGGWSRNTAGITSTTVLHHPMGDLMKVTRDINAPISKISFGKDVWELDVDQGILQHGSSGAPYFDQNHRIIGQHYIRPQSGSTPDCNISITQGGRFDRSWTTTPVIGGLLDPGNTNTLTTNTTNVSSLASIGTSSNLSAVPGTYLGVNGFFLHFNSIPGETSYYLDMFDVTLNSMQTTNYPITYSTSNVQGNFYYAFTSGHTYKFRVYGKCSKLPSVYSSNFLFGSTAGSCTNGPVSTTLSITLGCGGGTGCPYTNFNWPAIAGASQYQVEYQIFNISQGITRPPVVFTTSSSGTSQNITPVSGTGWTIKYRVKVNCSGTWGNYSGYSPVFSIK